MFPFLPTATINDLAHEHLGHDRQPRRQASPPIPGEAFAGDALRPDPIFMGLRALVQTGPIGALVQWMEGRAESLEHQSEGVTLPGTIVENRAGDVIEIPGRDQQDERFAA